MFLFRPGFRRCDSAPVFCLLLEIVKRIWSLGSYCLPHRQSLVIISGTIYYVAIFLRDVSRDEDEGEADEERNRRFYFPNEKYTGKIPRLFRSFGLLEPPGFVGRDSRFREILVFLMSSGLWKVLHVLVLFDVINTLG